MLLTYSNESMQHYTCKQLAMQLSAELWACKPLANFMLTEHPQLTS